MANPFIIPGPTLDALINLLECVETNWGEDVARQLAEEARTKLGEAPVVECEKVRTQTASSLRMYRELSDQSNIEGTWGKGAR